MFLRKKTIRNKKTGAVYTYAYAVENRWRKKGARQKVKAYLGKVIVAKPLAQMPFAEFLGVSQEGLGAIISSKSFERVLQDLIKWELSLHEPHGAEVDLDKGEVLLGGNPACIALNEGMLATYTLRRLLRFKPETDAGYELAKYCVEAGLRVPQDVFIALFEKIPQ